MLVSLHDQKFGAKNCKTNCKLSFFLTVNASQLLLFINRANKILSCCKPIAGLQMTSQRPLSVVKDKSIFLLFGTKNPFSCKFFDKNFIVFPISGGKKHANKVYYGKCGNGNLTTNMAALSRGCKPTIRYGGSGKNVKTL